MKIPLLGQSAESIEYDVSQQLTQNWYVHISGEGKSQVSLYPTPGIKQFANVGIGPIRGAIEYDDELYVISNDELYRVNSAGVGQLLGTLNTTQGMVSMAHNGPDNGTEIMMVDGTNGYIWDSAASTLTVIADAQYPDTATQVVFMDGYFIVNDPTTTGRIIISASYDGTSWDATDIATAERDPDVLRALVVANRQLWLIGAHTAEQWFNSGAADFPFEPNPSGFSQWGTVAPFSALEIAGFTFWLSENNEGCGLVVMSGGGQPQVISTMEVSTQIQKLSVITDAYAWAYQKYGHTFYVLTFPTGQKTFAYDLATQKWHNWHNVDLGHHRAATHTFVFGKHLIGDYVTGEVCELDWETYTDNGKQIKRIRRSRSIHADDKSVRHHGVWLDIKEGVGDLTTIDPQISLRWRDNNGSWSNYHQRSMGKQGETGKKIVWRGLNRSSDRVYELSVSDPVNAVLVDSYAKIEGDPREFG